MVVVTDVGPRIIRLGFVGGDNMFKEFDNVGMTGGDVWRNYGGHRIWHGPEVKPRSYAPDNDPVANEWDGKTLKLVQPVEAITGIQKEIEISMDPKQNRMTLLHRLTNRNLWPVELCPWALTVMKGPGRAIFPQEPPSTSLLPSRPMVMWGYTDMADKRWTWGTKYIQLRCDPATPQTKPQKIGLGNSLGWSAYSRDGQVFLKKFAFDPKAVYADFGCNNETYTRGDMLEVETLGPLQKVEPGAHVEHTEQWFLFKAEVGDSDAQIEAALAPFM